MRIALLALHFAEYASRLAVALSAKHEVLLLLRSSNAQGELTADLRRRVEESVNVRYIDVRRLRDPRLLATWFSVNRFIRQFSPDVLHVQEGHAFLSGWAVPWFSKTLPIVFTVHDPVGHSGGTCMDGLGWKILRWIRLRANRLIVHGPQMRADLEGSDRRMVGRVDVIPHGLLGETSVDDDPAAGEPATFLFFGRVMAYKGLSYLLDACDILQRRGHAVRLIVAGTGTDLDRHRARIAASGCVELIDRYVPSAEVESLFRRSTAVVLPYTDATQSGVAAIALAHSRPVISTAVGDLPEVVIDGRTGLLVPPRDGEALADAMEKLLVDRGLRDSLAAGAGRHAKDTLSWSRIAELTEGTHRRAIEAHGARGSKAFSAARVQGITERR